MARSQFTFTFRNAEPGAAVTFSAAVYSSPADQVADGPALALDAARTVAVWSDASELSATWVDGSGASITAEASLDRPVVVETGGVAGASPAPSGGSGWVETVLSTSLADWTDDSVGTWVSVGGVISQTNATALTANLTTLAELTGVQVIVEADVRFPNGQDAGTFPAGQMTAFISPTDLIEHASGWGLVGEVAGDTGPCDVVNVGDGGAGVLTGPATVPVNTWHTLRALVTVTDQVVWLDGVLAVRGIVVGPVATTTPGPKNIGIQATGLVDFRNLKVWTQTLPA